MNLYEKPDLRSYSSIEILERFGCIHTQYPVQFHIQAIEFQVSENMQESGQIYTIQDNKKNIC